MAKGEGGEKQRPARTVPRGTWAQAGALPDWQAARYDVPGVRVGHLRVGFFSGSSAVLFLSLSVRARLRRIRFGRRARCFTVTHAQFPNRPVIYILVGAKNEYGAKLLKNSSVFPRQRVGFE